ncbi:metabolite traffic protein EboE [Egicoccus halophilus]|uniref:Xylose isomerase n=1 Tax=Egicoccus halophilus TaxID=1670830 RepID=A0A8J3A7X4_9ACTN|nr:metabolite traffic protein EboE [Egicoccus halophilus]GGI03449.1 xylose isomerase [Egicoccus halophilus]
MRLRARDGSTLHLAYCSNVHAEESATAVADRLEGIAARLRTHLAVPSIGVGLWLAAPAAAALCRDDTARAAFARRLTDAGVEIVTCNAFPYAAFHAPVVKREVYRPDWADPRRLAYTLDVATVLADLLPGDVAEGSISTLPLGWRAWLDADGRAAAARALREVGQRLDELAERTGRRIRLGLEPEPGCTLDTALAVTEWVAELGHQAIGVSLDACHLAVEFEDPATVARRLREAGCPVVKLQVANALRSPGGSADEHHDRLARYAEPRFLHQTRAVDATGTVLGTDDLPEALRGGLPTGPQWRSHVHVPVHRAEGTTRDVLEAVLDEVVGGAAPLTSHLEVETYTWTVLPPGERPTTDVQLADALARELAWTRDALLARGCTSEAP